MKEGYLQNKIRELNTELEQIKREMENSVNQITEKIKEFKDYFERSYERLKPFIEAESSIVVMEDHFRSFIINEINEKHNKTDIVLKTHVLNELKKLHKTNEFIVREQLTSIEVKIDKNLDQVVEVINQKLGCNLKIIEVGK